MAALLVNIGDRTARAAAVLARVRHRQLQCALHGNYRGSARYAALARRLRRYVQQAAAVA